MIWRVDRRDTFLALRAARRSRSGPLTVAWVPGDPAEPPRVAFAIGRRVGPAVARNRLRRRLRSWLRETEVPVPAGAYLVSASPSAADLDYRHLGAALDSAVTRATTRPADRADRRGSTP